MGQIKSAVMTAAGTSQVSTQRTKFLGVDFARDGSDAVSKVEIRNGTSGSSTILFTLIADHAGHGGHMVFPSGNYILCEDGMHVTATGDDIIGVTVIYQT